MILKPSAWILLSATSITITSRILLRKARPKPVTADKRPLQWARCWRLIDCAVEYYYSQSTTTARVQTSSKRNTKIKIVAVLWTHTSRNLPRPNGSQFMRAWHQLPTGKGISPAPGLGRSIPSLLDVNLLITADSWASYRQAGGSRIWL